jgi:uncharacterized protein (TIGR03089 family)
VPDPTPSSLLADALASDPSRPLLTFFDDATGERTELSVATFANWVAKTANLLQDDLGLAAGARVRLQLPVHWQGAVWLQACWALGLAVVLDEPDAAGPADLAVVEHGQAEVDAAEAVSLGLGPMGLPRPGSSPAYAGALDYDREVHAHGDRFAPALPPTPGVPALVEGGRVVTAGDLAAAALAGPDPGGALLVTEPPSSLAAALAVTLVPLATGATAVLVRHLDPDRLPARIEQEHLTAALGDTTGLLRAWRSGEPGMS